MKMSVDDGSDEVVMLRDRAVSGVEEAASKGARLAEEASISISLSGTRCVLLEGRELLSPRWGRTGPYRCKKGRRIVSRCVDHG